FAAGLAATPLVFFNTFYVWPKLLAAALGVLSVLLIGRGLRKWQPGGLILGIICYGAAILTHAGNLLAAPVIVGFGILVLRKEWRLIGPGKWVPSKTVLGRALAGILLGVAVVGGLLVLHDSLAPKSSYGVTFLLAGEGTFGLTALQIENLVINFYKKLTW